MRQSIRITGDSPDAQRVVERSIALSLGRYRQALVELTVKLDGNCCEVRASLRARVKVRVQVCERSPGEAVRQAVARASREIARHIRLHEAHLTQAVYGSPPTSLPSRRS